MCLLVPYWIDPQQPWGPLGYGVTAFLLEDACTIIRLFDHELPPLSHCNIEKNVSYFSLNHHVQCNMGPIVVRGLWYPFTMVGVPNWHHRLASFEK